MTTSDVEVCAEAFYGVTGGYYRNPDPRRAAQAVAHWLRLIAIDAEHITRRPGLAYAFARIMQISDEASASCMPLLSSYDGPHQELVEQFVELAPRFPKALVAVTAPLGLDLLWSEFFVTGDVAALRHLVDVLDWKDRIREGLDRWLRERTWFGGSKRAATASALGAVGLHVDLDRRSIVTTGDLDCLCSDLAKYQRVRIFPMLPFPMPTDEAILVATKSGAQWGLRLNSRDHERVAEFCRAEATRPGGLARLDLTKPPPPSETAPFQL